MNNVRQNIINTNLNNQEKIPDFSEINRPLNPHIETLKIVFLYLLISLLWIFFVDNVGVLLNNGKVEQFIHKYALWFSAFISGLLIYGINFYELKLFSKAVGAANSYSNILKNTREKLDKKEDEISLRNNEFVKQSFSLQKSEQRFRLIMEAANDGIWDYDIENHRYVFSIIYKPSFGYELNDIPYTLEAWVDLVHPDDKEKVLEIFEGYLKNKSEKYEFHYRVRTKSGRYRWVLSTGKAVWDENGNPTHVAGSHTDITDHRQMEDNLYSLAFYDPLTGLPNKTYFQKKTNELIDIYKNTNQKMALVYFDIDDFKNINEISGPHMGDKMLQYIAYILKGHAKVPDVCGRFTGDGFGILFCNIKDREEVAQKIGQLYQQIKRAWIFKTQEFFISVSMGVAIYPDHGTEFTDLLRNAEAAMYQVKRSGKNGCSFYKEDMHQKTVEYIRISNDIRHAIENEQFELYYQPQVDMATENIIGAEALVRWPHPERGLISPALFIPIAEETGYINQIEKWILNTACREKLKWNTMGFDNLKMSVNISGKRLTQDDFISDIKKIMSKNHMRGHDLEFEITETAVISDLDRALVVIRNLKEMGISIALDDFGTGYSSLSYLKRLPIDVLKIDREFILHIQHEDDEEFIVQSVIQLAKNLNIKVVAEGVETEDQLSFLKKNECNIAQGYYYSRPIPAKDMEEMLLKSKNINDIVYNDNYKPGF